MKLALLAAVAVLVVVSGASARENGARRNVSWARAQANGRVTVELHDYYGLTLRFVAARRGATCIGLGAPIRERGGPAWLRFRCIAWLRSAEGPQLAGNVRASFVLQAPPATVTGLKVVRCTGIVCPVH